MYRLKAEYAGQPQGDLARVLPGLKLKAGEDYQVISFSFDENEQPELA